MRSLLAFGLVALLAFAGAGAARAADPTVAAVGDMGCSPYDPSYNGGLGTPTACRQQYVSDLLVNPLPAALLDLGDNQYDNGSLSEFKAVYDPTFGRANAVAFPSIGNAEYDTSDARGFFDYFSRAGVTARILSKGAGTSSFYDGYYSFDVGAWHLIALNSNCREVGGCGAGSRQERWLRSDLAANPYRCTLAYWHHPRWNTGGLGNDSTTTAFWQALYDAHADVALAGHGNHHYERFAPQDPWGDPDGKGIREFIVSTGGQSHGTPQGPGGSDTSQVLDYTTFGVLRLTLHPSGYDWRFVPESGGTFTDSGSGTCHWATAQKPNAPSVKAVAGENVVRLSWSTPPDGGTPVTGYKVYRRAADGNETLLQTLGLVTALDDTSARGGTKYYYRVAAVNRVGEGSRSSEASATPTSPPPPPPPPPRPVPPLPPTLPGSIPGPAAPATVAPAAPAATAFLGFGTTVVVNRHGVARVRVRCTAAASCAGTLSASLVATPSAARVPRFARFSIAPGKTRTVRVRLKQADARALRRISRARLGARRLRLRATLALGPARRTETALVAVRRRR